MPLLTWTEAFSVKVPSIDDQHKKLIELVNELAAGMEAKKSREAMASVLTKLLDYTNYHFRYEEDLFDKTVYPLRGEHKQEHTKIKDKVLEIQKRFEASQSGVLSIETSHFLKDWLVQHIQGSDMKYTDHLLKNGVK